MNCDPRFHPLLSDFGVAALEGDAGTVYGLWPDLTLAYTNPAWANFALLNGGEPEVSARWTLGRCVLEAIAGPLGPYFIEHYGRCLRERRPWEHVYECSSPDVYRQFHMTAFPLGRSEGVLVVNSLRVESSHTRTAWPPLEQLYRDGNGLVVQCCHCRRVRRKGADQVWDWVPDWVVAMPRNTSHGLCEPCLAFYYGEASAMEHPQPMRTSD